MIHHPRATFLPSGGGGSFADPKVAYYFQLRDYVARRGASAAAPARRWTTRPATFASWPPPSLGDHRWLSGGTSTTWTSVTTFGPDGVRGRARARPRGQQVDGAGLMGRGVRMLRRSCRGGLTASNHRVEEDRAVPGRPRGGHRHADAGTGSVTQERLSAGYRLGMGKARPPCTAGLSAKASFPTVGCTCRARHSMRAMYSHVKHRYG